VIGERAHTLTPSPASFLVCEIFSRAGLASAEAQGRVLAEDAGYSAADVAAMKATEFRWLTGHYLGTVHGKANAWVPNKDARCRRDITNEYRAPAELPALTTLSPHCLRTALSPLRIPAGGRGGGRGGENDYVVREAEAALAAAKLAGDDVGEIARLVAAVAAAKRASDVVSRAKGAGGERVRGRPCVVLMLLPLLCPSSPPPRPRSPTPPAPAPSPAARHCAPLRCL
jgi:hypothetical protein